MKTRLLILFWVALAVGCTSDSDHDYGPRPVLADPGHVSLGVRYFNSCAEVKSFLRQRVASRASSFSNR